MRECMRGVCDKRISNCVTIIPGKCVGSFEFLTFLNSQEFFEFFSHNAECEKHIAAKSAIHRFNIATSNKTILCVLDLQPVVVHGALNIMIPPMRKLPNSLLSRLIKIFVCIANKGKQRNATKEDWTIITEADKETLWFYFWLMLRGMRNVSFVDFVFA